MNKANERKEEQSPTQLNLDGDPADLSRPWEPFKKIPIHLFGTNKTTVHDHRERKCGRRYVTSGNCLDPVRGCSGGKTNQGHGCWWGCYAKEASLRFHRLFDAPVSMILNEARLTKELAKLDDEWIRIGVNGDPCFDWNLTERVAKIVSNNRKISVIVTRFWTRPDSEILDGLSDEGVHLHGTLCAFDSEWHRRMSTNILRDYSLIGGVSKIRLVTFAFKRNSDLWKTQRRLAAGFDVIEQPARVLRTNPIWNYLDAFRYNPHKSYVSGKKDARRLTAGPLYPDEYLSCDSICPVCIHKCGTQRIKH